MMEERDLVMATPMDRRQSLLSLREICKTFSMNIQTYDILRCVSFDLYAEEMVALTGASGTGKTTLLQIMGLLDWPSKGTVSVGGIGFPVGDKSHTYSHLQQRDTVRQKWIGFVYQYHHLLPELTALENVVLPQRIAGVARDIAAHNAVRLLDELGLSARKQHFPQQLSGGEQQRVAIARALANAPQIVLADEPTGNLDDQTAQQVFQLLTETVQRKKMAIVMATHNLDLASKMTRHVKLHSGKLVE